MEIVCKIVKRVAATFPQIGNECVDAFLTSDPHQFFCYIVLWETKNYCGHRSVFSDKPCEPVFFARVSCAVLVWHEKKTINLRHPNMICRCLSPKPLIPLP